MTDGVFSGSFASAQDDDLEFYVTAQANSRKKVLLFEQNHAGSVVASRTGNSILDSLRSLEQ